EFGSAIDDADYTRAWADAQRDLAGSVRQRAGERLTKRADSEEGVSPAAVSREARELYRAFASEGMTDREQLVDAVHGELQKAIPDITRDQAMDAISGYGNYRLLSQEQIEIQRRQHAAELQELAKQRDMAVGTAPKKSGVQREKPTAEKRRLAKITARQKRLGGYKTVDAEAELQSAIDSIQTRLTNEIEDLGNAIATRTQLPAKGNKVEYDAETQALKERRDDLKKQYKEMFDSPEANARRQAERTVKMLQARIAENERRIREGEAKVEGGEMFTTPEIEALRAHNATLVRELRDIRQVQQIGDKIADLNEQIETGHFVEKPARVPRVPPAAVLDAKTRMAQVMQRWSRAKAEAARAARPMWRKAADVGVEATMLLPRALQSGFDFGHVLIHGGVYTMGHPLRSARAFADSLRAFASERGQVRAEEMVRSSHRYDLGKRAGLQLTEWGGTPSKQEEMAMGRWIERIPVVRNFARSFVSFLNLTRMAAFEAQCDNLARNGEPTLEEAREIARGVNIFSGRSSLKPSTATAVGSALFYSMRYQASRFQMLALRPLWTGTRRTRWSNAKEYGRFIGGAAVMYALAGLMGADIEDDPRSSDFGAIKFGNTRLKPFSGLTGAIVMLSRIGSGQTKTAKGEIRELTGPERAFGASSSEDVASRYVLAKGSPVASLGLDVVLRREDFQGRPVTLARPLTVARRMSEMAIPFNPPDIYEAMQEQGIPKGMAMGAFAMLGAAMQTYGSTEAERLQPSSMYRALRSMGMSRPDAIAKVRALGLEPQTKDTMPAEDRDIRYGTDAEQAQWLAKQIKALTYIENDVVTATDKLTGKKVKVVQRVGEPHKGKELKVAELRRLEAAKRGKK
ncbi:MAG: hypothetical protein IMZ50_13470, partial [Candidatus Atribacteria bacterium]|nr:hypothetical protein [Candidatus Atribacteria bacterium]